MNLLANYLQIILAVKETIVDETVIYLKDLLCSFLQGQLLQ
jgi:hypothetical protein